MATVNCERCGKQMVLEAGTGRHAICDICRKDILDAQAARRLARKGPDALPDVPVVGMPSTTAPVPAPQSPAQPDAAPEPLPQTAARVAKAGRRRAGPLPSAPKPVRHSRRPAYRQLPFSYYVAAAVAGGVFVFMGLIAGFVIWGPAQVAPVTAAEQDSSVTGGHPPSPGMEPPNVSPTSRPEGAQPTTPLETNAPPATSRVGDETDLTSSNGRGREKPAAPSDEAATESETVSPEVVNRDETGPESTTTQTTATDETASPESITGEPTIKEVEKRPEMSPKILAVIANAKRQYGRYKLIAGIQTLLSNYRFSEAASRLEDEADQDEFRSAVLKEVRTAGSVLDGMGKTIAALSGKRIEVRLPTGMLRGTVRGYSPGMITIMNEAGAPCLLSFKRAPFDFLRDLAKDVGEKDFLLFCAYSGRGLPEGVPKRKLSETARIVLEYPTWAKKEKDAQDLLKHLRELHEKGKWPELITGIVDAARKHIDTYTIGAAARGELGGMLREALRKKKKVITYQQKVSPSGDYSGVTDTYISCNRDEGTMNFGSNDTMEFWQQERFPIIRFELVDLPQDVKVHKATLAFFVKETRYEQKLVAAIYLMAEDWKEGDQTGGNAKSGTTWQFRDALSKTKWNTPGGDVLKDDYGHDAAGIVGYAQMAKGQWAQADVTIGVQTWLSNKRPNYGFQLRHAVGSDGRVFVPTSEAPDPSLSPNLTLEYEGTVEGAEAVVPQDFQWLLFEEGGKAEDAEIGGTDI